MTLVSPGIEIRERDINTTVRQFGTTTAALAGLSQWGPAFKRTSVISESEFVKNNGEPTDYTFNTFFNATNYLLYGSDLKFVRVINSTVAKNSSTLYNYIKTTVNVAGTGYEVDDTIPFTYDNKTNEIVKLTVTGSPTIGTTPEAHKTPLNFNYRGVDHLVFRRQLEVLDVTGAGDDYTFKIQSQIGANPAVDLTADIDAQHDETAATLASKVQAAVDADLNLTAVVNGGDSSKVDVTFTDVSDDRVILQYLDNVSPADILVEAAAKQPVQALTYSLTVATGVAAAGDDIPTGFIIIDDENVGAIVIDPGDDQDVIAGKIETAINAITNITDDVTVSRTNNVITLTFKATSLTPYGESSITSFNIDTATNGGSDIIDGLQYSINQDQAFAYATQQLTVTNFSIARVFPLSVDHNVPLNDASTSGELATAIKTYFDGLGASSPYYVEVLGSKVSLYDKVVGTYGAKTYLVDTNVVSQGLTVTRNLVESLDGVFLDNVGLANSIYDYLITVQDGGQDVYEVTKGNTNPNTLRVKFKTAGIPDSQFTFLASSSAHGMSVDRTYIQQAQDGELITTGKITKVGPNGEIERVFIPSEAIAKLVDDGEVTTNLADFSHTIVTEYGNGATLSFEILRQSILASTDLDDYPAATLSTSLDNTEVPSIFGKYVGGYGDKVTVDVINFADFQANLRDRNLTLDVFPTGGTVNISLGVASAQPASADEYAVFVYYNDELQETHVVSTDPEAKNSSGDSIYIDNYFKNNNSFYIVAGANYWPTKSSRYVFGGGVDSGATTADYIKGWGEFSDKETVTVDILLLGASANESEATTTTIQKDGLSNIAEVREDALAVISPPREFFLNGETPKDINTQLTDIINWRLGVDEAGDPVTFDMNVQTTHGFIVSNYKYQFDKYNNKYRWVSMAGDIGGLIANNDTVANVWNSFAFHNRGLIQNVQDLAMNPRRGHRDQLYPLELNPVIEEAGGGVVLYGDKTMISKQSNFSRVNVRRLFYRLEREIEFTAKFTLGENNNEFTRNAFLLTVQQYLRRIQDLGGVERFVVKCDEENNPETEIARNNFFCDIGIIPPKSINFIYLNFLAADTQTSLQILDV